MKKHVFYILFLLLFSNSLLFANEGFGGKIGVSFQFGTHIQRIGLMYQLHYHFNFFQISNGVSIHFNRKALGPPKSGFEIQSLLGCQFYWGDYDKNKKYLLSEYSLMAENKYSAGVMYKYYLDQIETSQFTGGIFFNVDKFGLVFENDLLSRPKGYEDKYRTGNLALSYTHDSLQFTIQTTHWTGKAIDGKWTQNSEYPSKHGYRDLSEAKYGKYSHGIWAFRVDYLWKFNQTLRIETGIDAEQIRHAAQNKLIHDFSITSPDKMKNKNPHYPMLQKDGTPYLYKENQKIRPPKYYLQLGLNPFMFY